MLDVDLAAIRRLVEGMDYRPLFVTVSGAHLYGFPSSDSDVDLRGCHQLPLRDVVGLDLPNQTLEHKTVHDGTEVELVSHEIGKYLRLLVRNNGYILEQVFSPIVVLGQEFLDELRPLAVRCIKPNDHPAARSPSRCEPSAMSVVRLSLGRQRLTEVRDAVVNLVRDDVQRVPFRDFQSSGNLLRQLKTHCLVRLDHRQLVRGNPECTAPRILLVGPDFPFDGDQKPVGEQLLPRKQLAIDNWHDKIPSTSIYCVLGE